MINDAQFIALLPQLASTLLVLFVLALIAWHRCHRTTAAVTVLGLVLTLATIPFAQQAAPQAVTSLFVIDGLSLFFAGLVLAAAIGCALLMWSHLDQLDGNREEMYLLLTLSVNGALMLVSAKDFVSLFISLELMTVPVYGMAGYLFMQRRGLEAVIKYLVLSAASTAILLFGMAFLYAQTGRMDFAGVATQLHSGFGNSAYLAEAGLLLVLAGLAFKLSLAPFHQWTLDVYEGATAPVGAFLATVGKVAVVAVLLRLLTDAGVFGAYPHMPAWSLLGVLAAIAALSILVGNLLAMRQDNLKRMLAASSVAHFGYLLVAVIGGGPFAIEAAGMYLAAYVATTLGAFGVISVLSSAADARDQETLGNLRGLAARSPFLAFALTVMLLSLAGIPLTAGFLGKFYVIAAGAAAGLWLLLGVIVLGSAIGLYVYLRVIATLYQPAEAGQGSLSPRGAGMLAVAVAVACVLVIGIWPAPVTDALELAGRLALR
jgi:NADH-quinone oxidoreductase subunit N